MLSKEERQAMMAKARAAKQEKQTVESVVAEAVDTLNDGDEYNFEPYDTVVEQHEHGTRLILLLNGLHKAEFQGKKEDCLQYASEFVENGKHDKVVNVNVD